MGKSKHAVEGGVHFTESSCHIFSYSSEEVTNYRKNHDFDRLWRRCERECLFSFQRRRENKLKMRCNEMNLLAEENSESPASKGRGEESIKRDLKGGQAMIRHIFTFYSLCSRNEVCLSFMSGRCLYVPWELLR